MRRVMGIAALAVLLISCESSDAAETDLQHARAVLERKRAGTATEDALGPLPLAAFKDAWEFRFGDGRTVLIVSTEYAGAILLYSSAGGLVTARRTGSALSVQSQDVNADGTPELLTEEVVGRGTGIRDHQFVLYSIGSAGIETAWHGEALTHRAIGDAQASRRVGFVRIHQSMFNTPAGLDHFVLVDDKVVESHDYELLSNPKGLVRVRERGDGAQRP
ncbi:MAG TPA: hypothetical protein VNL91_04270 [Thermoanaerobaculia bacterium]|nr:hypothetical protein [Thermoanaerobaculia bacterium]